MYVLQSSQTDVTQKSVATVINAVIFKNKCVGYLNYSHLTIADGEKEKHILSYPPSKKIQNHKRIPV